jgi:hypothetical protein
LLEALAVYPYNEDVRGYKGVLFLESNPLLYPLRLPRQFEIEERIQQESLFDIIDDRCVEAQHIEDDKNERANDQSKITGFENPYSTPFFGHPSTSRDRVTTRELKLEL